MSTAATTRWVAPGDCSIKLNSQSWFSPHRLPFERLAMVRTESTMLPLGTQAPDFSLPDTEGDTVSLRTKFQKKPVRNWKNNRVTLRPIGIVRSPYRYVHDAPRQAGVGAASQGVIQ